MPIYFIEKLVVEIYTIGYEPMGEGIVIKIKGNNKTLFCAVIDCYEINEQNETLKIIDGDKIDLICITHFDEDHCKGLEKILRLANSNTTILYPNGVIFSTGINSNYAKNVINQICQFLKMNNSNTKKPKMVSCGENQKIIENIKFSNVINNEIYELNVNTYTPLTSIIEKRRAKYILGEITNQNPENNDYSIMMSMTLGRLKLLFCSDIENNIIDELNKNKLKNSTSFFYDVIDYVKIPHHASRGSIKMFDLFSSVSTISNSVSTVYRKSKLPNKSVLEKYLKKR